MLKFLRDTSRLGAPFCVVKIQLLNGKALYFPNGENTIFPPPLRGRECSFQVLTVKGGLW